MVRQVVIAQCGITFDAAALKRANIPDSVFTGHGLPLTPPLPHGPDGAVRTASAPTDSAARDNKRLEAYGYEARESGESERSVLTDAEELAMPVHDELQRKKWWWLLEIVPTNYAWQDGDGTWHEKWGCVLSRFVHSLPSHRRSC